MKKAINGSGFRLGAGRMIKEGKTMDFRVELATFIGMLFDKNISEEDKRELVEMRYEEAKRNKKSR